MVIRFADATWRHKELIKRVYVSACLDLKRWHYYMVVYVMIMAIYDKIFEHYVDNSYNCYHEQAAIVPSWL